MSVVAGFSDAASRTDMTGFGAPGPGRAGIARRVRRAGLSRSVIVGIVLLVAIFVVFCISISVGDYPVPLADVVPGIFGRGEGRIPYIIQTLRLPRALTALLVGAALGFSGAIFQSLARNPLASPDIIGITQGASVSAVFIIIVIGGSYAFVSTGALLGGFIAASLIYVLAYRRGMSSYRLVLIGIGVSAMLQAVTSYLMTRAEIYDAARATVWLTGSLNNRGWEHVRPVGVVMAALFPAVLYLARGLRVLQLGDDAAKGLGVPVERTRGALIAVAVAMAAVATASAGPINFVAFIAAPIARRLVRQPLTLVPSALVGALVLLSSDLVARRIFAPTELPVGVITGIVGAPYLLWLLARSNKIGKGG
ncbi:FecCD family ABC transporter permease [Desertimonas flava]|uniref:FecCD family ABC transporter permease n=1 Tax=Desertimonas flava TaxID=2064846 RepID=UPI0019694898|nr:iron chelate uptake ABC transporter family permease subunit [Desertimonas flava]